MSYYYDGYYDNVSRHDGTVYYDYYSYDYEHYDLYRYESFYFEQSVYLYVWEALVILTTLANILVISVFSRKRMRNSTNVILMCIAVTDSMTGIVTLPVYMYVYTSVKDGDLHMTEGWCEAFMIVKFFVSKAFHTMSIWLTVCLSFQRLVAVCFPFRAQSMFTTPKTILMIVLVAILAPVLHLYHLFNKKAVTAVDGEEETSNECVWTLKEPCSEGCVYLWVKFYFVHFIPCLLLVVCTAAMIIVLCRTVQKINTTSSTKGRHEGTDRRTADSRRISLMVLAVVVVFLIPEVPYGLYVLLSVTFHLSTVGLMSMKTNRMFHCVYEISLVLSFHANFWIYFIMNRRFRRSLRRLFHPVHALCCGIVGTIRRKSSTIRRRTMSSSLGSPQNTQPTSGGLEMNTLQERDVRTP